jgi:hypothetical protein
MKQKKIKMGFFEDGHPTNPHWREFCPGSSTFRTHHSAEKVVETHAWR